MERDIGENLVALSEAGHTGTVSAFACPFGETTFAAKRGLATCSRRAGILPGINRGDVDRTQLRAVELGAARRASPAGAAMLKTCIETKAWLFFFTHDVSDSPSPYGAPAIWLRSWRRVRSRRRGAGGADAGRRAVRRDRLSAEGQLAATKA